MNKKNNSTSKYCEGVLKILTKSLKEFFLQESQARSLNCSQFFFFFFEKRTPVLLLKKHPFLDGCLRLLSNFGTNYYFLKNSGPATLTKRVILDN